MLMTSPFPSLQVVLAVRTNPSTVSPNGVGPAGQFIQMTKFMERTAFALTPENLQALGKSITTGGAAEKIRTVELAGNIAVILSQQQGNQGAQQAAMQLVDLLKGAARDSSTAVQAWAGAVMARLSAPAERGAMVGRLVNDPYWVARLLGLSSMGVMPVPEQKTFAARAATNDADLTVRAYAAAQADLLERLPTTAPSTVPTAAATSPTAPPPPPPPTTTGGSPTASTKPAIDVVVPALPLTLPPASQPTTPLRPQ
jgi:hypothetical protein